MYAKRNYKFGYSGEVCIVCTNGYIEAAFGKIEVEQIADQVENDAYLWVLIAVGAFAILLLIVACSLRHRDVKEDKKWKSKYIQERLKQIEEQAKPI